MVSRNKCPVTTNYIKKSDRSHYINDFYMPSAIEPPLNIRYVMLSLMYLLISIFCTGITVEHFRNVLLIGRTYD